MVFLPRNSLIEFHPERPAFALNVLDQKADLIHLVGWDMIVRIGDREVLWTLMTNKLLRWNYYSYPDHQNNR